MTKNIKRLYRSQEEKVIAGVCGGIAEYFEIDPIWLRLIGILLIFLDGVGIIGYIVLWILMPENPKQKKRKNTIIEEKVEKISKKVKSEFNKEKKEKEKNGNNIDNYKFKRHHKKHHHESNSNIIIGAILVLIGILFLAKEFFWTFASKIFWPAIIIGIGIILLFRRK